MNANQHLDAAPVHPPAEPALAAEGEYVLVPREPTEAMLQAAGIAFLDGVHAYEKTGDTDTPFARFYKAAVSAAPCPDPAQSAVLTNPHTGEPRDYRDVESDPAGTLIVAPGETLRPASIETDRHPDGRPVFAYLGWPKNRERFHLDIIYPGTTRIEDEYDYRPLYGPPDPAQSADTPSEAVALLREAIKALDGWDDDPVDGETWIARAERYIELVSRPQLARDEVSEAEVEAAYAAINDDVEVIVDSWLVRKALEAAARVRASAPECQHCRKPHAPRAEIANGCYLSTADVPIERRAVLCSCGAGDD